jgi:hypothetical protein
VVTDGVLTADFLWLKNFLYFQLYFLMEHLRLAPAGLCLLRTGQGAVFSMRVGWSEP